MNGTFEIFTNKEWMILPSFVHGILPTVMNNANNHSMLGIDREKKNPMCINAQGDDIFREYEVTEDGQVLPVYDGWAGIDYLKDLKQPFVNVIPIDGPITRNGGACSYGSKDIRDWMMKASDNPYCQCHVLVINTPGGSAWAKNDFQQAIDYAHSKGMRVIAFIDGLCASAGMYLASLCDEVYVMNLKDQLGCVGVMASFFTMKSGDKNQFTNETYREYYDPESVDKNKEMRDIAEEEDSTLLIEELAKLGREFRADMKAAFPAADIEKHLKGKIFDAQDVMGIFCDGQMLLGEVIARGFALGDGSAKPIERTANRKIGKREKIQRPAAEGRMAAGAAKENILSTQLNNVTNMKEKFPSLFAALAVEEMQMTEEGAFMNMDLLATLNAKIEAMTKEAADAKALAESLTAEKEALTAAHEQAITELKAANDKAIENLNAEHTAAIEAKDAEIKTLTENAGKADETLKAKDDEIAQLKSDMEGQKAQVEQLQADVDGAKASIETASVTIAERDILLAERDQQIQDLNARIAELENDPGAGAQAGAAPKDNGAGAEVAGPAVKSYVYNPSLSYKENMERKKKFESAEAE